MAEHLNKTQKLDTPRQMRFNDKPFVEDIEALMNLVNKEVTDKYIKVKGLGQIEEMSRLLISGKTSPKQCQKCKNTV